MTCFYGDPRCRCQVCPCQDGDACRYESMPCDCHSPSMPCDCGQEDCPESQPMAPPPQVVN